MAEPPSSSPTKPSTNHAQPPSEEQTTEVEQESPQSSDSPISDQFIQSPEPTSPIPLPDCINSINGHRSFSGALSAFYSCYEDLVAHLDSVKTAIDSKLVRQTPPIAPIHALPAEKNPIVDTRDSVPNSSPNINQESDKEKENGLERGTLSELESLCAKMSSRCLKKYIISNLGEPEKLREEVPKALKLAPNPARLILESSGRFFLQGRKAYVVNSPMVAGREASVLMLECFLLMEKENNAVKIEKGIKEEAEEWARLWKKRLLGEGGLESACEIDAKGLLMFLGCYGVPSSFRYKDINDLVNASNVKAIVGVLKKSSVLMEKITESIDWMVKNKMIIEGINIAYSFELQDTIKTRSILASFLREAKESGKSVKSSSRGSSAAMYDATKKHLAALRSVVKCAERHGIDVANLIPGWQVNEKITKLEDKIKDYESDMTLQKRKADEIDSSRKIYNVEMKRMRHTIHGLPQQSVAYPPPLSHGADINPGSTGATYVRGESIVDSTGHVIGYTNQHYGHVVYEDRLVGSGHYAGQRSTHDLVSHYAAQPSSADLVSHYAGQPSSAHYAGPTPGSELYRFADTVSVAETDAYTGIASNPVGGVPPVVSSHQQHSSYLY